MLKYILILLTLTLTSCFTNRAENRALNEKIFAKYLAKRPMMQSAGDSLLPQEGVLPAMGQPGSVCSTAGAVK